jgi:hypothetical protein
MAAISDSLNYRMLVIILGSFNQIANFFGPGASGRTRSENLIGSRVFRTLNHQKVEGGECYLRDEEDRGNAGDVHRESIVQIRSKDPPITKCHFSNPIETAADIKMPLPHAG